MYCKECGTKNNKESLFCKECGNGNLGKEAKNEIQSYNPLTGGARVKIVIFCLFLVGTIFFGVVPLLIILINIYIMKKDNSFNPIIKSQKYIAIYLYILVIGGLLLIVSAYYTDGAHSYDFSARTEVYNKDIIFKSSMMFIMGALFAPIIIGFLIWLFNFFYFKPLVEHQDWIVKNGIFSDEEEERTFLGDLSSTIKNKLTGKPTSNNAYKKESSVFFSKADELIKWEKLLEKGLISKDEFIEEKQKLLNLGG